MDEYGLKDKKYFLHVGTMEYRKNIKLCLMAYKCYVDNLLDIGISDIPLFVLIGGEGWTFDVEINELIDVIGKGLVKKMGYVSEKEKIDLIKNANALYYPSFYEGFGFPPLEAILLGVPVISSFGGSLGEVLGNNCLLIDPFDVTGIIKTMNIFGSKKKIIDNINEKKIQLLQKYNWEKAAREFRQLLSEIRDK
jgi:alpha-1,3-rhamnosyl/mannosyltransferase